MMPFTSFLAPDEQLRRFLAPRQRNVSVPQLLKESEERPAIDEYAAWLAADNRPVPAAAETRTLEDRGLPPGPTRTLEDRPGILSRGRDVPLASPGPLPPTWTGLGFRGDERPATDADLERLRRGTIGVVPGSVREVTPTPAPRDVWADQTPAPATGAGPDTDRLAMFRQYVQSPPMSWDGSTLTTRRAGPGLEDYLRGTVRPGEQGIIGITEQQRIDPSTIVARLAGTVEPTPQQRLAAEQLFQGYLGGLTDLQHRAVSGPQLERERIASAERIAGQQAGLQRDLERMRQRDLSAYLFGLTTGKISPDQFSTLLDAREMLDETGRSSPRTDEGRSLRERLTDKFKALATRPTDEDFHTALDPAITKEGKLDVDRLLRGVGGHTKVRQALPDVARRLLERGVGSPADVAAQLERAMYDRMHFSGTPEVGPFAYRHGLTKGPWMETPRGQVPVRGYGMMGSPSTLGYALTSREDAARYRDELPLLADLLQQIYTVGNLGTKPKP